MKIIFALILPLMLLISCDKETNNVHDSEGELIAGVECLVIKTIDNKILEATNLRDFNLNLTPGERIVFSYYPVMSASICMQGTTVRLTAIKRK